MNLDVESAMAEMVESETQDVSYCGLREGVRSAMQSVLICQVLSHEWCVGAETSEVVFGLLLVGSCQASVAVAPASLRWRCALTKRMCMLKESAIGSDLVTRKVHAVENDRDQTRVIEAAVSGRLKLARWTEFRRRRKSQTGGRAVRSGRIGG